MVNRVANHETAADHNKRKCLIGDTKGLKGKAKRKKIHKKIHSKYHNVHSYVINSGCLSIWPT